MPLTPQQLADFQRLRQSYAPVVEAQRRKQQAQANLEKMHGLPPVKPQPKADGGAVIGINVASDRKAGIHYADLIVDGKKTIETRNSDTLRPYVGKRVAIVRTGSGPAKAIGEVTIGEPMVVNKKKFRSLEGQHHVPEGSTYDITTPTKHLYPLSDPQRYEQEHDVGHGIVARKVMHKAKGGKVKELEQYLRDREGQYGLKRLQRAADEIPGLENMYTLQALKEAFGGDNAKALMTMNPEDFEKFASPLTQRLKTAFAPTQTSIDKHNLPTDEYIQYLAKIRGFNDVPFLSANKEEQGLPLTPFVTGHEGRHRSRAMAKIGKTKSLVRLLPSSELREPFPRRSREEYIQALKNELAMTGNMINPEKYRDVLTNELIRRPAIQLPEVYKRGGKVTHAHHLEIEERPL